MEVRVGVRNIARELSFESDQSSSQVQEAVSAGLSEGSVISLRDDHGRVLLVPADALGYVEVGEQEKSKVGFGSA
ncbi:MAG: DUF3107 domain-containing protein [Ornithinimicrobium sp.]